MAATALIQFTQGANTDVAGKAVLGDYGDFSAVTVTNGDNTNVVSWIIYLLDAPPDSVTFPPASQPQILAQAVDATPTVAFTPDVAGTYRVMLEVVDSLDSIDRDIRCFAIPDERGFVRPPYQQNPEPLPQELPVIITVDPRPIKPDEQNYGTNVRGWSGNGTADQLDGFFRKYGDLPFQTVTTTPFTATALQPPLHLVNVTAIAGDAVFNLPTAPRNGFVSRVAVRGTGFSVTITPAGGGAIDGDPDLTITTGGVFLVHRGTNQWETITSVGGGGVDPLSNILFVDKNTSAVTQDGSIGAPFDTLTAALVAAAVGDTLLVAPEDYSAEGTLAISQDVRIAPFSPLLFSAAGIQADYAGGLLTLADVTLAASTVLTLFGATVDTLTLDTFAVAILDSVAVTAFAGASGVGAIDARNSTLPMPIDVTSLSAENCQIVVGAGSTITVQTAALPIVRSAIDQASPITITFGGAAGDLLVDGYTDYWIGLSEAGSGFTLVNGTKTVLGAELTNLDRVWYADADTTVVGGDGNIETPFATLAEAIAVIEAAPGSGFFRTLLCQGLFAEATITFNASIKASSVAPNQRFLWDGDVVLAAAGVFNFWGARIEDSANTIDVSNVSGTLIGDHCEFREITGLGGALLTDTTTTDIVLNTVALTRCTVSGLVTLTVGNTWKDSTIGGVVTITTGNHSADRCAFGDDITVTAGDLRLTNSTVGSTSTVTCAGTLFVDAITYERLIIDSVTIVAAAIHVLGVAVQEQSIAWDAAAPEVLTVLAVGHPAGVYLITGTAVVTTGAATGTLDRDIEWKPPSLASDSSASTGADATTTGSKFVEAIPIVSDGTAVVTVTFTGAAITGSPSIDLYATATLLGTST